MTMYAIGTMYFNGSVIIFYGEKTDVEPRIHNTQAQYKTVYFYETFEQMEEIIEEDKAFYRESKEIEFIKI